MRLIHDTFALGVDFSWDPGSFFAVARLRVGGFAFRFPPVCVLNIFPGASRARGADTREEGHQLLLVHGACFALGGLLLGFGKLFSQMRDCAPAVS